MSVKKKTGIILLTAAAMVIPADAAKRWYLITNRRIQPAEI